MIYSIQHRTRFSYSAPIRESLMELRMHPRSEGATRCVWFDVEIVPPPTVHTYRDCWNNTVHSFDIPGLHEELEIMTRAVVETDVPTDSTPLNAQRAAERPASWEELDAHAAELDFWDFLLPSRFAKPTELLRSLIDEWNIVRRAPPLKLLFELQTRIYNGFSYAPQTTRADSPIDEALDARSGVCQDFTHIFITLARDVGIPCRYVSGYLHHEESDRSLSNATHAWAEAWLPDTGWIGFDPTNNSLAGERHICTALGRDYADVPPTRGVFKGRAQTELQVEVKVECLKSIPAEALYPDTENRSATAQSTLAQAQRSALAAVWPPPSALFVDDVSEQAQQQQQSMMSPKATDQR
jgi:transglutaminase-like putative cysteine protease